MTRWVTAFAVAALLGSSPAWAQTTRIDDPFTEVTTDTLLQSHTCSTPATTCWTKSVDTNGSAGITAFAATDQATPFPVGGSARVIYTATPGSAFSSASYDVKVTLIQLQSGQSDQDPFGLPGRFTDDSNYYVCGVDGSTSPQYFILKRLTGTTYTLKSGPSTFIANDVLECRYRGTTLSIWKTGVMVDCVVDTDITATGAAGIAQGNFWTAGNADITGQWIIDGYQAIDQTGQGGDVGCGTAPKPNSLTLVGAQ